MAQHRAHPLSTPLASRAERSTTRRVFTRSFRILLYVVAALLIAITLFLIVLQTSWARRQLASVVASQAERVIHGDISIARIDGNLFSEATLEDVAIRRGGRTVVFVDRVTARYDLPALIGGDITLSHIGLHRPIINLSRGPEGFALAGLFGGGGSKRASGSGPRFAIDTLTVDEGLIAIGEKPAQVGGFRVPDRIEGLRARLGLARQGERTTVAIEGLSFTGVAPAIDVRSLTGEVVVGARDLVLREVSVHMSDSQFTVDGTIENYRAIGGR